MEGANGGGPSVPEGANDGGVGAVSLHADPELHLFQQHAHHDACRTGGGGGTGWVCVCGWGGHAAHGASDARRSCPAAPYCGGGVAVGVGGGVGLGECPAGAPLALPCPPLPSPPHPSPPLALPCPLRPHPGPATGHPPQLTHRTPAPPAHPHQLPHRALGGWWCCSAVVSSCLSQTSPAPPPTPCGRWPTRGACRLRWAGREGRGWAHGVGWEWWVGGGGGGTWASRAAVGWTWLGRPPLPSGNPSPAR